MKYLKSLLIVLVTSASLSAVAGPHADALGKCLAENTTGKDRKDLARWMFVAMTAHPEMRPLSAATDVDREQSSQVMGALFTKLLSEACPQETKAAIQNEGSQAMQIAFGTLGQLAMQELMSDQEVKKAVGGFERHLDQKKVEAALSAR